MFSVVDRGRPEPDLGIASKDIQYLRGGKLMKVAYFDCFSGASGDMILGAMLDAGLDFEHLEHELAKLHLSHYALRRQEVLKAGIKGTQLVVDVDQSHHRHSHRHLDDIVEIIHGSSLGENIKSRSVQVFRRLAEAEASVHNEPVDHVHFHEVGAVDAIIDIVGAVVGLAALGIETVYCSPLHVGAGTVECEHGILPVPAPATAQILKGTPFYSTGIIGELLTPTGAAILTTVASDFGPMRPMAVDRIGYGAGTRELDIPNMLRIFFGELDGVQAACKTEQVAVLETSIDDMSPQVYEYVMTGARDLGASEVFLSPVQMKKNRPGTLLTVICKPDLARLVAEFLLKETTSIGLRWKFEYMLRVPTEMLEIPTRYGMIRCKVAKMGDTNINATPEYADCKRIALEQGVPLKNVMLMANRILVAT